MLSIKDPTAGIDAVIAADQSKPMDRSAEKARLGDFQERIYRSSQLSPPLFKGG